MKKITLLISALALIAFGWQTNAQVLNQAAAWPNANWTLSGNYTATVLLNDPTIRTNFSFDNDEAGSPSPDTIMAESSVIEPKVVHSAGETLLNVAYNYNIEDQLRLEFFDADGGLWKTWGSDISSPSITSTTPEVCLLPDGLTVSAISSTAVDSSSWTEPSNFTTLCPVYTPGYKEPFDDFLPDCWSEAGSGTPQNGTGNLGTSEWNATSFLNAGGADDAVKINLHDTGREEWLISPVFDLSYFIYELVINSGITAKDSTNAGKMGDDDVVQVLTSTDGGGTWSAIYTWDKNNQPSNTGTYTRIDLSAYSTATSQFAIWATEGNLDDPENFDFFINNFEIRIPPICFSPSTVTSANLTSTSVDLAWIKKGTATSWEVEWDLAGFTQGTGNSRIVGTNSHNLSGLIPATSYTYYLRTICDGVANSSLWTGPYNFTTLCPVNTPNYKETFDFDDFILPYCWSEAGDGMPPERYSQLGASLWTAGSFLNVDPIFTKDAVKISLNKTSRQEWLISPVFDLSNGGWELAINAGMTANYTSEPANMGSDDLVQVLISTDGGETWSAIYTWDKNNQPSNTGTYTRIDLSAYTDVTSQFAVWATEGSIDDDADDDADDDVDNANGYDFFINDFEIRIPPICFSPSTVTSANLTSTSVDLAWTENGAATSWEAEWGTTSFIQGTGTSSTTATNSHNLSGLIPATSYDYYVRAICGDANSSPWTGPFNFTTLCAVYTPDYKEPFDDFLPDCWSEAGSGTPQNGTGNLGTSEWNATSFLNAGGADDAVKINLHDTGDEEWLISPVFDLSNGGWELAINAGMTANNSSEPANMGSDDLVQVLISTDGGGTWSAIYTWDKNNQPTNTGTYTKIDLSAYTAATSQFAIWATEGNLDNEENFDFFINDFEIRIPSICNSPSTVTSANLTSTSVDLAWIENGTATSWEVEWGTTSFTQGTGTSSTTATNSHNLSGLTPATSYDFYVRTICASGDVSSWSSKHSFNTLIQTPVGVSCMVNATTNALIEEFNSLGTWTGDISTTNTNGDWVLPSSGPTPTATTGPNAAYSGTNYAYYEASGATTDNASLVSPAIDLTNALTEAELSFWMFAYGADITTLRVGVSTSATGPFTEIFSTSGQLQNSNADAWQEVGVNLDTYLGQTIYIEYNYASIGGFNADLAIDLVKVETCTATLDIRINAVNIALTVSPNPSKGVFTLTGTTSDLKELNIKVINPLGQTVYSKSNFNNITNINEKIDLSNKTKGIYFINVTSDKGVKTYKVIVK